MPAATVSDGRSGILRKPSEQAIRAYLEMLAAGLGQEINVDALIGSRLHAAEFWMPNKCNLRCRHCYVNTHAEEHVMDPEMYASLVTQLIDESGIVDILIPGMEPLMAPKHAEAVIRAASGARSIGMVTNGTLIGSQIDWLETVPLTVVNVSLDGPSIIHNSIRGRHAFERSVAGIALLRTRRPDVRLITNTTTMHSNKDALVETARIADDLGCDFSAFHPYEWSVQSTHALALSPKKIADAYEQLIEGFLRQHLGSMVLEFDGSTFGALLELCARGVLDNMHLREDGRGWLFLAMEISGRELLVNLMGYPRHNVHTIRVTENGGLSSCRHMALTVGWRGMGNLRASSLHELLASPGVRADTAHHWTEFRDAIAAASPAGITRLHERLHEHLNIAHRGSPYLDAQHVISSATSLRR
ncbi:radical SAM protein [Candidatus Uhrbacteria bacterium]|nr:radical SAM protein [Candidatus Uhrbacteria bacterium]